MNKLWTSFKNLCGNLLKSPSWESVQAKYKNIGGKRGIRLRQKKYKKYFLKYGNNVVINEGVLFDKPESIILHDDVQINYGSYIVGSGGVSIGYKTLIGPFCFISSANHAIHDSSSFFYHSGYDYYPTKIGAHCLVSGYARILAGAEISSGTFIANSAVVCRGKYSENSHLFGLPAKIKMVARDHQEINCNKEEVVIILCPDRYYYKLKSFFLSLGLPQCLLIKDTRDIPIGSKVIIIFTDEPREIQEYKQQVSSKFQQVNIWVPEKFSRIISFQQARFGSETLIEQSLPLNIEITCDALPSKGMEKPLLDRLFLQSCKYMLRFMAKSNLVKNSDLLCMLVCLEYINKVDQEFAGMFNATLLTRYNIKIDLIDINSYLKSHLGVEQISELKEYEIILFKIFCGDKYENGLSYNLIRSRILKNTVTHIIICYGIIAYNLGHKDLYNLAYDKLCSYNYCTGADYILNEVGGKAYYYRPFLCLFLWYKWSQLYDKAKILHRIKNKFVWQVKHDKDSNYWSDNDFLCNERCEYSMSLISNLLSTLNLFESSSGYEFVLNATNYEQPYLLLQKIWSHIIKKLILDCSSTCVEVLPWPNDKPYAVSIRYDVDRGVNLQRIMEIISDIKKTGLDPCSSWYWFANNISKEKTSLLEKYGNEVGLHTLGKYENDGIGVGVTSHCGPEAEYWRGIGDSRALYTEFLSFQVSRPLVIFQGNTEISITPLHFPMEISNNDDDMFSNVEMTEKIKIQIMSSGHIILATHPDIVNPRPYSFIKDLSLNDGWSAPVCEVVKRVQSVYFCSSLKLYRCGNNYYLKGSHNIDRLAVKLYSLHGCTKKIIDLQAGIFEML